MSIITNEDLCTGCGLCVTVCPEEALEACGEVLLDENKCTDCLNCLDYCPNDALEERK